jgi:methionine-gamma-lyase
MSQQPPHDRRRPGPSTTLVHGERRASGTARGEAVAPPVVPASTFSFDDAAAFAQAAHDPAETAFYARYGGPNQAQAARVLAELEGAEGALLAASGMAALTTTALALVGAGDHVVVQDRVYGGTVALGADLLPRLGVEVTVVAQDDVAAFEDAIGPRTRLVLVETPSNPLLGITDLPAVAAAAQRHGAVLAVDATFATPILQRPLALGADLVIHSATKYLGGHADLLAGAVAGPRALLDRIWTTSLVVGAALGARDAWLLLRGMRTLAMRVERQSATAQALAEALAGHPRVAAVHYPGLPSHPGHDLARRQMRAFGGVLSFVLDGDGARAEAVIDRMRLVRRAASLGGVETLAVRPAAMLAAQLDEGGRRRTGITDGLVRIAVGIEDAEDLLADVLGALDG